MEYPDEVGVKDYAAWAEEGGATAADRCATVWDAFMDLEPWPVSGDALTRYAIPQRVFK